jgi:hypothetical protein
MTVVQDRYGSADVVEFRDIDYPQIEAPDLIRHVSSCSKEGVPA